jgi:hypothetical protein
MLSMRAAISLFTWKLGSVDRDELGYVPDHVECRKGRRSVAADRIALWWVCPKV